MKAETYQDLMREDKKQEEDTFIKYQPLAYQILAEEEK